MEAAHIINHSQSGLNCIGNGILLRSDIHSLFDANLLGIDPYTLKVTTTPALLETTYAKLNGKKIMARIDGSHPNPDYLQLKWSESGLGE